MFIVNICFAFVLQLNNLLSHWQKKCKFKILSQIIADYLPIRDKDHINILSDQTFSVVYALTKIRNRLHSTTARVSLYFKSWMRGQR